MLNYKVTIPPTQFIAQLEQNVFANTINPTDGMMRYDGDLGQNSMTPAYSA